MQMDCDGFSDTDCSAYTPKSSVGPELINSIVLIQLYSSKVLFR